MNKVIKALAVVALAAPLVGPPPALSAGAASPALFHKAMGGDPALKSYTASATLAAHMTHPLPLRKTLNGKAWYLKPQLKINFDDVPKQLAKFKDLSASAASFDGSSAEYTLASGVDDGSTSTYDLNPKKSGTRVKTVTVVVTDATARVAKVQWNYADGSTLSVVPTYTTVSGIRVATTFQIDASFPGYGVDGTLTLSNVNVNAPVDPSVFASPKP